MPEKKPINYQTVNRKSVDDSQAEAEIRKLLDERLEACQTKDINRLMSLFSPDCVYFDTVPPLQFIGSSAIRHNFLRWFDLYEGPIRLETSNVHITASENVAFAYMLIADSGKRKYGGKIWLRSTTCLQKLDNKWLITHEHVSLPRNPKTGMAVIDLVP